MVQVVEGQRTFSVDEYHRMADAGVFGPDERVELIRGVIRQLSPKGRRHVQAVTLANHLFTPRLAGRAVVQIQDPVRFQGLSSEPEPDVAVLSSSDPRDAGSQDTVAVLVLEVADSSLRFDREEKAQMYAEAELSEYWIVNLVDDALEVLRDPKDGVYRTRLVLKRTESISPLAFPDLVVAVTDLIP